MPKFTVEILSGMCNVLKSFITALSIDSETNVRPRLDLHFETDFREVLDDSQICHHPAEHGWSFCGARFLILAEEDSEQQDIVNEWSSDGMKPDITERRLAHLFSHKTIDWSFDRSLICDRVWNRIMLGISRIKWLPKITDEVNNITDKFTSPTLAIHIRTWKHPWDPATNRGYSFEVYKEGILKYLDKVKTVYIVSDNHDVLGDYIDLLKDHNVIISKKSDAFSKFQWGAIDMLSASKCDYLVCSRQSTFSECIWWFSGCRQEVTALF
jgi:hypothetical protein